ncbi:hypothetical protein B0H13DRAFT_1880656 [Mycena leptocephala]|nr:hypothetical protein B0H13DRAFT_1880656 [Mycena leptocephala]
MAVTRASSSPRTRSRTSASASSSASSSTSTPRSWRVRSGNSGALEVKHATLYPRTVALGFRGTKFAASSVQPSNSSCLGCVPCNRRKKRIFRIIGPLPPNILAQPVLQELFEARAELYPNATAGALVLAPIPAPAFAPISASAAYHAPTVVGEVADEMVLERSASPQTPIRQTRQGQTLRFEYGGYGHVHYSPDGHILPRSNSSHSNVLLNDSNDEEELQYPPDVTFDVGTPVILFAWHNSMEPPIQTKVYPCLDPTGSIRIGQVILQDFQQSLHAMGLPVGSEIQRFLDVSSYWSSLDAWTNPIPIFGRNKLQKKYCKGMGGREAADQSLVYIKTVGVDITPPDHFIELLT